MFEYNLVEGPHHAGSVMMMNSSNDEDGSEFRYNVIRGNTVASAVMVGALWAFIKMCPRRVVQEHDGSQWSMRSRQRSG